MSRLLDILEEKVTFIINGEKIIESTRKRREDKFGTKHRHKIRNIDRKNSGCTN